MKNLKSFDEFLNESNEMKNFKPGQKIKWSGPKGEVEDVIKSIDGIYLVLKSGGKIPYQSVIECDEAIVNEAAMPKFNDNQGNPTKLDYEVLNMAVSGLPSDVVKAISEVEANGWSKRTMASPHSASKKGVGTGYVTYHTISLIFEPDYKGLRYLTIGLRKRTSGPGTGYIVIDAEKVSKYGNGYSSEAMLPFDKGIAREFFEYSDAAFIKEGGVTIGELFDEYIKPNLK